jgi:hypothetical protein
MKKYILLFAFLSFMSYSALAQVTSQGTDFYVSWGLNHTRSATQITMQIRVAATQDAHVTLTFNADASTDAFDVLAGEVYTYNLNDTQKTNVFSDATGTSNKSLYIHSTTPVSVYALNQVSTTTDATNVLPVTNYGTDYYHLSYKGYLFGTSQWADGYTIVAIMNGTTIYENGVLKANLNAGQVYSAYHGSMDATGMHITSNNPIAYYVTNQCVLVPITISACDCLYQQLPPVNAWGNTFLVPVSRRGKERVIRRINHDIVYP